MLCESSKCFVSPVNAFRFLLMLMEFHNFFGEFHESILSFKDALGVQ